MFGNQGDDDVPLMPRAENRLGGTDEGERSGEGERRFRQRRARGERCVLSCAHHRFALELLDPLQNLGLAQHAFFSEQLNQGVQRCQHPETGEQSSARPS